MVRHFRVTNPGKRAFTYAYDGAEYTVTPGGEGMVATEAVARHLADYAREVGLTLGLVELEARLVPERQPAHRCPFPGCSFEGEFEPFTAHVREHAARSGVRR